jgi:outer membrane protein assembly factor BamB
MDDPHTENTMTGTAASYNRRCLLFAVCLACVISRSAAASDWPRFRGPNGTGVSSDTGIPVAIGEKQNLLWKVAIPGNGNSSPIVSKQRIFLQSASSDGSKRTIYCLDLANGNMLWSQSVAGSTSSPQPHQKNTLASSTAVADGLRVYMPFWDGRNISIAAYDYGGTRLWTRDLGPYTSQHGAGLAPVIVNDKVIVANDQDGSSEVVALDAANGAIAWKTPRPAYRACYSTPLLLERPGLTPDVVVTSTFGVAGYDPESGAERWKWKWESNERRLRTVSSPVVSEGRVFFTSGDGRGDRQTAAVNLNRDSNAPSLAWENRKLFLPYVPCMLTYGEYLYFVNDAGMGACFVARTGEEVWLNRLEGGNITASPVMVEDRIYAFTENGTVIVLAADPTFKILASSPLDEGVMASPAVADGRLLVRGKEHLYCFGK